MTTTRRWRRQRRKVLAERRRLEVEKVERTVAALAGDPAPKYRGWRGLRPGRST